MGAEKAKTPPKEATEPPITQGTAPDPKAGEERTYTVDELHERSRSLFGVPAIAIDGAFDGVSRVNWTAGDAKKRIDTFLGREVEVAETEQP